MATISCTKARYEELKKNPLLFLRIEENSYYNYNRKDWVKEVNWVPTDNDFQTTIDYKELGDGRQSHILIIAGNEVVDEDTNNNETDSNQEINENKIVKFDFHVADSNSPRDWLCIINSYIKRTRNSNDKFPYIHLLWFLNKEKWTFEQLTTAIRSYDIQSQPFITAVLSKIGTCLSEYKQRLLQRTLSQFNVNYTPYIPAMIPEALSYANPQLMNNGLYKNLFEKTDYILCPDIEHQVVLSIPNNTTNPLLSLYIWLHSSMGTINYDSLISLFSIVSLKTQLDIVKRYFHDIRADRTSFDASLLEQFKDNKYADFIRYRYCIETPEAPINLGVSFLCDCVLTISKTQGQSFQSFDGILDFAMSHCDVTKPSIRLGMENFIPRCNGGAVYNTSFLGFIDYGITCKLDESKFTEENLKKTIISMLDRRPKYRYYACGFDHSALSEEQLPNCLKVKDKTPILNCYTTLPFPDKWVVKNSDYTWLNTILKEPLPAKGQYEAERDIIIDLGQTSTETLAQHIRNLAAQEEQVGDGLFLIMSNKVHLYSLLFQYSQPVNMRIYPQRSAVIGLKFDVFGLVNSITEEFGSPFAQDSNTARNKFYERESEIVYKRVVDALKNDIGTECYKGDYFETAYDRSSLLKLNKLYYFRGSYSEKTTENERCFLTTQIKKGKFLPFCAPKLSDVHNRITDLPFFWCRGLECFHNCLNKQTLSECSEWSEYSLYHLIEILGYPKLHLTEGGYEPDSIVTEFIAVANRVLKKFKRLKCRSCGHLMFTDWSSGYNRYNYYSCINPTCSEYGNAVYLSNCFKCKTGLIDSRDSAKCPNGWYICPTCHSCCDDAQYDRQAQRYIVSKKPVPQRIQNMLGKGHNDKGIFFCHICGSELELVPERGSGIMGCPKCKKIFDEDVPPEFQ